MRLFTNLHRLLDIKRKTLAEGGDGLVGYQDSQAKGYDRFVVRDWTNWTDMCNVKCANVNFTKFNLKTNQAL